jgi:2-haloalkanoic acid dehalogenase type II
MDSVWIVFDSHGTLFDTQAQVQALQVFRPECARPDLELQNEVLKEAFAMMTMGLVPVTAAKFVRNILQNWRHRQLDEEKVENILRRLQVKPGVGAMFEQLRRRQRRTCVFTNWNATVANKALRAAGVKVDRVISASDIGEGYWKPSPRAYDALRTSLNCRRCIFVSAHPWDAAGADHEAGFVSIFLAHNQAYPPYLPPVAIADSVVAVPAMIDKVLKQQ